MSEYEEREELYLGSGDAEGEGEAVEQDTEHAEGRNDEFYAVPKERGIMIWSLLSVLFSVASVLLCGIFYLGLAFSVCAIVLSLVSRYKLGYFDKMGIFGLIVGIFGLVFGIFSTVLTLTGMMDKLLGR